MCSITVTSILTNSADVVKINVVGVIAGSTILCHASLSVAQC